MLYKSESEFAAALKAGPVGGVYLLYGGEPFLVERYAGMIEKNFGDGMFSLQRLDGRKLDCDLLEDAVETLPFMGGEKCVRLDDLETKLPGDQLDRVLAVAADVPPGCTLLITGKGGFDPKSAAGKKLVKLCADSGCAAELGARTGQGLASFVKSEARRHGCEISPEVAKLILKTCESDMATLSTEIAKICAYAGDEPVQERHVEAVAIPRTEARVFDLSKAILAGNGQRAMELLRDLFALRESPVMILAVLAMGYADLYRARVARDEGKTPGDVMGLFAYKGREFRVNNAWKSRLPAPVLRRCLDTLLACDRRLKSNPTDGRVLLEQAVVTLLHLQRETVWIS